MDICQAVLFSLLCMLSKQLFLSLLLQVGALYVWITIYHTYGRESIFQPWETLTQDFYNFDTSK